MAIQHRRGNERDYDPSKMLAGEIGTSLDVQKEHVSFGPGKSKTVMFKEDLITETTEISRLAIEEAKAWAKGDSFTRYTVTPDGSALVPGEVVDTSTDNAKYYSELAESSADDSAISEQNALTSETNAKTSEDNASVSETRAGVSETNAAESARQAAESASRAERIASGNIRPMFVDTLPTGDDIEEKVLYFVPSDDPQTRNAKVEYMWNPDAHDWECLGPTTVIVVTNSQTQDGIVTKGQNQNRKVWGTDANGNPAWRDTQIKHLTTAEYNSLPATERNNSVFYVTDDNQGYSFPDVYNRLNNIISEVMNLAHPIGSWYWSDSPTDPAELFGGTWERIEEGRAPISAGTNYPVGSKGGSADAVVVKHSHTVSTSGGNHRHGYSHSNQPQNGGGSLTIAPNIGLGGSGAASGQCGLRLGWNDNTNYSNNLSMTGTAAETGVSGTGKNMMPYQATYMWRRIA